MMRNWKLKRVAALVALMTALCVFAAAICASAAEPPADGAPEAPPAFAVEGDYSGKLVILHTNDVHGGINAAEGVLGMAAVAQLKADYEAAGADVILLDGGDEIQGDPLVNFSQGQTAVDVMNAVGYMAMAPGNHEFDFGLANLETLAEHMEFPIISANVIDAETNETVFDANTVFETEGGLKVGVFGLTTPETATKAHPAKIQGISFLMGEELYAAAQAQVEALEAQECDLIVCLGHLGIDAESEPNRSTDLLAEVSGIDLFIDAHSHSVIDGNAEENTVNGAMLVSTGTKLANIGVVTYDAEDGLEAALVPAGAYSGADAAVAEAVAKIAADVQADLGETFAETTVALNGEREPGVRTAETNLGDLIADALLWYAEEQGEEVDASVTNGGGIRASIAAGDITRLDVNTVLPFGNTVSIVKISGAELLEALEASTSTTPAAIGAFPQVAGMAFEINTDVEYENGEMYPDSTYYAPANPGARVTITSVGDKAFDEAATYSIATNDFLAAGGDTFYAFKAADVNYDLGVPMDAAVMDYIARVLDGSVGDDYAEPAGRITITGSGQPVAPDLPAGPFADVTPDAWYFDAVQYVYTSAIMTGTSETTFEPETSVSRAMAVTTLYRIAGEPSVGGGEPVAGEAADGGATAAPAFSDVEAGSWYEAAVMWASQNGVVEGVGDGLFAPEALITRQDLAVILDRYLTYAGVNLVVTMQWIEFTDAEQIGDYAMNALQLLYKVGIITGDGALGVSPQDNATRAELAAMLQRLTETAAAFPAAA